MDHPYWMAEDCPNCGEEDIEGQNKGARSHSSTWGHAFPCCSDECGRAFLNNPKRVEMEIELVELRVTSANQNLVTLRKALKVMKGDKSVP